jgi:hypothetical protein
VVSHNANKKKILHLSMFEKWNFYTFIRGIVLVANNAENCSALLPTAQKNDQCCCLQRRSFFRIVACNTEKYSNFS